ncbi:protein kinase domain-containing protein [Salinithrix halophila]|uniref:Protein kinase n=1 Tax=Salinithrix halophila TaxID=1485204 RepID=A0ABV8JF64_9BACL
MEGKRLAGRYDILQRAGGGGMAVVYKAKDLLLDRLVAVKVMNEALTHDDGFIRRFMREVKASATLSHPNVVNVFDVNREGSLYYMTMEYVEGPTLHEVIAKQSPLSLEDSVSIVSQICDGLTHAHEHGIVHRDIKPHNIMCAPNGRVKITDFGISVLLGNPGITQTGMVMGSVQYFSPEQATGHPVGYSSDLYSLGVVLYQMVTGQVPFEGDSVVSISLKHVQEQARDPREINPAIPDSLCRVIYKALEKDPSKRFQTANEMKVELRQALSPSESSPHHPIPENHNGLPRKRKRNKRPKKGKLLMGLVGAAFIAAAIFGWTALEKGNPITGKQERQVEEKKATQEDKEKNKLPGHHPWWKEIPREPQDNRSFRAFKVRGKSNSGNYFIQVQVGDIPDKQFYYDIYVVDRFSSRLILKGRSKMINRKPGLLYTPVEWVEEIPKPLLPDEGLVKIELYRLRGGEKIDATDNLLEMRGKPPKNR